MKTVLLIPKTWDVRNVVWPWGCRSFLTLCCFCPIPKARVAVQYLYIFMWSQTVLLDFEVHVSIQFEP